MEMKVNSKQLFLSGWYRSAELKKSLLLLLHFAMNTSKKTQLALVYIRYSSHAQDNGNSPAAQMTCAENYTEAHQMTIEQIYHDYAKTGRNTNREGYQQM